MSLTGQNTRHKSTLLLKALGTPDAAEAALTDRVSMALVIASKVSARRMVVSFAGRSRVDPRPAGDQPISAAAFPLFGVAEQPRPQYDHHPRDRDRRPHRLVPPWVGGDEEQHVHGGE